MYRKRLVLLAIPVLIFLFVFPCYAKVETSYVSDSDGNKQTIPLAYDVETMFVSFPASPDTLSEAKDICVDTGGNLYVLDSGNQRILKLSCDGDLLQEFKPQGEYALLEPQGIFVDDTGNIYIADTGNGRILILDSEGVVIHELTQPDDSLYDSDYPFEPVKVGVNSLGQIYVINNLDYHGFTILDLDNQFKGYFAATRLNKDRITEWIQKFASESQKEQMGKAIPAQHTNFLIAEDGSIYVTTANVEYAQMKQLSTVGNNFYPKQDSFGDGIQDYIMVLQKKEDIEQRFVDVCVDENGVVSILDNTTGKIYQYNSSGEMLFVFGGTGNWKGRMTDAVAMAQDSEGSIYVLDESSGTIQKFVPTEFAGTIHEALALYNSGDYDGAKVLWQQVLSIAPNYPPANTGMGKAEMKKKNYAVAMNDYKIAGDKSGYIDAFSKYLGTVIQKHFPEIVLLVIIFVVAVIQMVSFLKEKSGLFRKNEYQYHAGRHILIVTLFAPWEAFPLIKYDRRKFYWLVPSCILLLAAASNVLRLFLLHYPVQEIKLEEVNLVQELLGFLVPLFLWILGYYYVSCIFSGAVKLREVYAASCYALLPYAVFTVPAALLTNILGEGSSSFLLFVTTVIWLWVFVLIFLGIMTMNRFSAGRTVIVILVSIFALLLLAVFGTLLYLLGAKLMNFGFEVIDECRRYLL